jgi:hypothetical protein
VRGRRSAFFKRRNCWHARSRAIFLRATSNKRLSVGCAITCPAETSNLRGITRQACCEVVVAGEELEVHVLRPALDHGSFIVMAKRYERGSTGQGSHQPFTRPVTI